MAVIVQLFLLSLSSNVIIPADGSNVAVNAVDETDADILEYRKMIADQIGNSESAIPTSDSQSLIQSSSPRVCLWGAPDPSIGVSMSSCTNIPSPQDFHLEAFVITLMGNAKRQENAECLKSTLQAQSTATTSIRTTLVPAIERSTINTKQLMSEAKLISRGDLKDGEIAVYLSHIQIWEQVVAKELPAAIIFEDDASVTNDFVSRLRDSYGDIPVGWDMLWLFDSPAVKLNHFNKPSTPIKCHPHVLEKNHGIGLDGYIISLEGAKKLLLSVMPIDRKPIDLVLHEQLQTNSFNAFVTNPPLVYDDFAMKSEIQDRYYSELQNLSNGKGKSTGAASGNASSLAAKSKTQHLSIPSFESQSTPPTTTALKPKATKKLITSIKTPQLVTTKKQPAQKSKVLVLKAKLLPTK